MQKQRYKALSIACRQIQQIPSTVYKALLQAYKQQMINKIPLSPVFRHLRINIQHLFQTRWRRGLMGIHSFKGKSIPIFRRVNQVLWQVMLASQLWKAEFKEIDACLLDQSSQYGANQQQLEWWVHTCIYCVTVKIYLTRILKPGL